MLLPGIHRARLHRAASRYRVTALTAVPTMIAMMLREREALAAADLSSVQTLRMGSAPLSEPLIGQVRQAFPECPDRYTATARRRPGPSCSAAPSADGLTPAIVRRRPHPAVQLRLMRDGNAVETRACWRCAAPR